MKRKILIIFIFILGFMLMPNVFAAELPREGVTYFMTYPNNEEVVTESYDEAVSEPERLIFEGVTDSNGQVTITGLGNQGEVRITSNGGETNVNLANQRTAEIKPKSVVNPKTGATCLFVILLVVGVTLVTIKTKKKKLLLVVPAVIAVTIMSNVKAAEDDFVVTIKNSLGQAVAGTPVKVYAKPIKVEGAPAVKVDANGGHFFDGQTIMYVKLPYNGISMPDLYDSVGQEKSDYYERNVSMAYKEGHYLSELTTPDQFSNGTTVKLQWVQDSDVHLVAVHGNGGYLDFYGKKLSDVFIYDMVSRVPIATRETKRIIMPYGVVKSFISDGKYNIGADATSTCSNYNQYGIIKNSEAYIGGSDDIYVCWNEKPDGIYINDKVAIGSKDDCFSGSPHYIDSDSFGSLVEMYGNSQYEMRFEGFSGSDPSVYLHEYTYNYVESAASSHFDNNSFSIENDGEGRYCSEPISRVEVIYHGNSVVNLTGNDLENDCQYYFTNASKKQTLSNYFSELYNYCATPTQK